MADYSADGIIVHAADLNSMWKVSDLGAVVGTAPSTGAKSTVTIKALSGTITTDANGYATITYPTAFPNGCGPAWGICSYGGNFDVNCVVKNTGATKTGVTFRFYSMAGSVVVSTGPIAFFTFAIGW